MDAMNRPGLFSALGLCIVFVIVFGIVPDLDRAVARLFFDPVSGTFPMKANPVATFARDAAMWLSWALAAPAILALVVKLVRPDRPLLMKGRTVAFITITIVLSAGIFSNLLFKGYWGRP